MRLVDPLKLSETKYIDSGERNLAITATTFSKLQREPLCAMCPVPGLRLFVLARS